jgi:hypothetical protein
MHQQSSCKALNPRFKFEIFGNIPLILVSTWRAAN